MNDYPWDELGLESDADRRTVKRAYARKLKKTRPDEDPEGFQKLRQAYEIALHLVEQPRAVALDVVANPTANSEAAAPAAANDDPRQDARYDAANAIVDELLTADNPVGAFARLVKDGPVELKARQVLERVLCRRLLQECEDERLIAIASRYYEWSASPPFPMGEHQLYQLHLLEQSYAARIYVKQLAADDSIPALQRQAAQVMLGQRPYELQYDAILNELGIRMWQHFGESWSHFLPNTGTVDFEIEQAISGGSNEVEIAGGVVFAAIFGIYIVFKNLVRSGGSVPDWAYVLAGVLLVAALVVGGVYLYRRRKKQPW